MTDKLTQRMRNYLNTAVISGVKLLHLTTDELSGLLDELESKQTFQQAFFRQSLMYDVVAEAYEEAKDQIAKDVEIKTRLCLESNSLFDRLRAAEKRIAELEAEKAELRQVEPDGWITDCDKLANEGVAAAYKKLFRESPIPQDIPFYFAKTLAAAAGIGKGE